MPPEKEDSVVKYVWSRAASYTGSLSFIHNVEVEKVLKNKYFFITQGQNLT